MNSIIELQVLNYVLQNKSLSILVDNNISPQQFSETHKPIAEFITSHTKHYGIVPDSATVLSEFPDDFSVMDVKDSPVYLADKLRQFLSYYAFGQKFPNIKKMFESGDVDGALASIKTVAEDILTEFSATGIGLDITKDTERLDIYEKRIAGIGEPVTLLNIDGIDDAFGGILRDDLISVVARTNHGKSFFLTYMAHNLHQQGFKIMYYTGEMEPAQIGYRYDSIHSHFSSRSLLFGKKELGMNKYVDDYREYIDELKNEKVPFIVIHPRDLGGRYMNINDLEKLIDEHKPDFIFIDQLSLFKDITSNSQTQERLKYDNIMKSFRLIVATRRIPIFVAVQSNREGAKKNEENEFDIPEVSNIAESDAIGQHSTRILSFCTNSNIIKMGVVKNRHGMQPIINFKVDFEHGIFTELKPKTISLAPEEDEEVDPNEPEVMF